MLVFSRKLKATADHLWPLAAFATGSKRPEADSQPNKNFALFPFEQVRDLARINGDLGHLGGLLKLWLTDDVRSVQFGQSTILAVLSKIEVTQEKMGKFMTKVAMPK